MAADTSEGVLTATEIRRFLLHQCSTPDDASDPSESPEAVTGKTKKWLSIPLTQLLKIMRQNSLDLAILFFVV